MLYTIDVRVSSHLNDCVGNNVKQKICSAFEFFPDTVFLIQSYTIDGLSHEEVQKSVSLATLYDPVLQDASLTPFSSSADWIIEVGFRPGVTDNAGRTARDTLALVLKRERDFSVYTAVQYHLSGELTRVQIERIAKDLLANELIQRYSIKSKEDWQKEPGFTSFAAKVTGVASSKVETIPLLSMNDNELLDFSRKNTLALTLEEMHVIRNYYSSPETLRERHENNIPSLPLDAEIEVLAQTWSEHCKHKIFSSFVSYKNCETGRKEEINSLYKTCIQQPTKLLRERMGDKDFCRSVFKDNAGVVSFSESHDVCIKVETHNSPSALDPYGGALTGIVGVNRDPMGTGLGADLVCNTDVFCFASPFYEGNLPPRLLHPRRVMEGVREGVEHGGNKSGVPTVNGSVVFDERFLGKPLVYCGTVGMIPREIAGRPGFQKSAQISDRVVMAGGKIGKDGIHGATFSSEELHEGSPATAVQIGDPITQRKLYDFMRRVRDMGLYNAITDNGAGGLSSSVGEMAEDTGGCKINLAKAPLKYDGLLPWEILLSEAQERMTFAVPTCHIARFMEIAQEMDVEAADLGEFTDSGFFYVTYDDTPVAFLSMEFLHNGLPQLHLEGCWDRPEQYPVGRSTFVDPDDNIVCVENVLQSSAIDQKALLLRMLGRLNICSKEYLIRQYDHEVKGGSVVKPLVGIMRDGPADAAILRPLLDEQTGIVLSHGICPKFSDADTYWMMANAIDEAVRNAVAVGADPERLAGVDNFCWCDPVQSEKTPDGTYKMAQLVRANKALEHFCLGFGVPCISGKDSMKNDYTGGGEKISIPPTVLFSILGIIKNVNKAVTSDFKSSLDKIYVLGLSRCELAGSELAQELELKGGSVPDVDLVSARQRYKYLHKAIQSGLITACHDLSDGGLGVALAEMSIGGRLGASVDLTSVPVVGQMSLTELLYTESASRLLVTVAPQNEEAFQEIFEGTSFAKIGEVANSDVLSISNAGSVRVNVSVNDLAEAFKRTLDW